MGRCIGAAGCVNASTPGSLKNSHLVLVLDIHLVRVMVDGLSQ